MGKKISTAGTGRVLPFGVPREGARRVATVHVDGSLTYDGSTFRSIKELPPECQALRVDVETAVQWRVLYSAIDPRRRRRPPGRHPGDQA
jgi:hypothetical protein